MKERKEESEEELGIFVGGGERRAGALRLYGDEFSVRWVRLSMLPIPFSRRVAILLAKYKYRAAVSRLLLRSRANPARGLFGQVASQAPNIHLTLPMML